MSLPNLPAPVNHARSPNFLNTVQSLQNIYFTAFNLIAQGNIDTQRAIFHQNVISQNAVPLLLGLESVSHEEELPKEWILECTQMFGTLIAQLYEIEQTSQGLETTTVKIPGPVTTIHTKKRGRPRKHINPEFLRDAMDPRRNITLANLARRLGVNRDTLRKELKKNNIGTKFSRIPNKDLDNIVKSYRQANPESGNGYVIGHLRSHNLRVQRSRVRASISRVDRLGQILRRQARKKTQRRRYNVARPNALWHIDGHHKLILWGIVIHGCVDGYSRTITGLRASNNNKASTVLEMFLDAILDYGIPSRVRGDRGGENRDVSILMILIRGLQRASFMWGSSTHNSRIERLWVEVGTQFARRWKAFFLQLEEHHQLNRYDSQHLWLLHFLFLELINKDCDNFKETWNAHPISGEGHYQSPNDMRLLGQLEHGIYVDECDKLSLEDIQQNYGTYGTPITRITGQSGAGHPSDEEDFIPIANDDANDATDWADIENAQQETLPNIRHEPIAVPDHSNPFTKQQMIAFTSTLNHYTTIGFNPSGYGLVEDEWEGLAYPVIGIIPAGRHGTKEIRIGLPENIWRPRAEHWGRALFIMNFLLYPVDNN